MSQRQPEDNNNLLRHIASTVKDILDRMVTKEDLEPLVTREEFEPVREQVGRLTEQVAFLGGQVEDIRDRMATKEELAEGLASVEARLTRKIEVETTAVRGDIEQVHLRLGGIDKAVSSRLDHVESEMSRMRSVLYLLVKDRPDMLRLLGQTPPAGG
jgi:BMFP domain-containing protein YqiC